MPALGFVHRPASEHAESGTFTAVRLHRATLFKSASGLSSSGSDNDNDNNNDSANYQRVHSPTQSCSDRITSVENQRVGEDAKISATVGSVGAKLQNTSGTAAPTAHRQPTAPAVPPGFQFAAQEIAQGSEMYPDAIAAPQGIFVRREINMNNSTAVGTPPFLDTTLLPVKCFSGT
ncbi:hypothetical protein LPJ66_006009 [Kickxella alabastrina]|uniref:Uncharacterized protein n=1 Tax=Kickxella alabastrina TaxID=61397 RepID=A0ACC1IEA6_9FUNG|nr:hypothetical protein LPJ66_006009 [Kickxella alabastrina]